MLPADSRRTVVFDLDGTLAATGPDIMRALNASLNEAGVDAMPRERMHELVSLGRGPRAMIEHCLGLHGRVVHASSVQRMADRYVEIYHENVAVESTLFAGCASVLEALRQRDDGLAVCTNKPERLAMALLDALGVLGLFAAVIGRDSRAYSKPDPRHLTDTVLAAGGDPARAVMVGDTHVDVATARAAGIPIVCVAFGYSDVAPESLGADALIHDYAELFGAIDALEQRALTDAG
jgi:phosphoglycolate phosphatase